MSGHRSLCQIVFSACVSCQNVLQHTEAANLYVIKNYSKLLLSINYDLLKQFYQKIALQT